VPVATVSAPSRVRRPTRPVRLKALGSGPALHLNLARRRLERGELALARAEAEQALRLDPAQYLAHLLLSEVHGRLGDEQAAFHELEMCEALSPRFADAIVRRGDLHTQYGRLDEAVAAYSQTLSVDPGHIVARVKLGTVYFARREFVRAAAAYREAVRLDPGLASGAHTIGDYYTLMMTLTRLETDAPLTAAGVGVAKPPAGRPGPWPAFCPGLEVVPPLEGDDDGTWLIKDPRHQTFFEAPEIESFLCRHLDGHTSPQRLRARIRIRFGVSLSADEISGFLQQLEQLGLLKGSAPEALEASPFSTAGGEPSPAAVPGAARPDGLTRYTSLPLRIFLRLALVAPWDLLSLRGLAEKSPVRKIAFFNPDRMLAGLVRRLGFVFTRGFVVASGLVAAAAAYVLATEFQRFWTESLLIWRPPGYLMLALVGILLVHVPHQFAHGLVCTRYGGHVRVCGIRFMLHVVPTFYCDVSDALYLRKKDHSLWTIGAGLYYQALALSLGVVFWSLTPWGTVAHAFWLAMASTAMWGLIFNGNPAIKRDMYHLLSGWLDMPDLRDRAFDSLRAWVRWLWAPEPLTARERNWLRAYALLAAVYGLLHLAYASSLFFYRSTSAFAGQGALVAVALGGVFFQDHVRAVGGPQDWIRRLTAVSMRSWAVWVGLAVPVVVVGLLPYPYHTGGPFVLLPNRRLDVRSELEGLVERIDVREGQWVKKGQPLASLVKRLHERNLAATEAQIEEKRAQLDLLRAGARPEEIAVARQKVEAARAHTEWSFPRAARYAELRKQGLVSAQDAENAQRQKTVDAEELALAESNLKLILSGARSQQIQAVEAEIASLEVVAANYRTDVERTVVRSPMAGRVVTPRVEELVGTYLKPGQRDLLMQIEDARVVRAEVEVPEEEGASVQPGADVQVVPWAFANRAFRGTVRRIAPVATTTTSSTNQSDDVFSSRSSAGAEVSLSGTSSTVVRVITEIPNPDGLLKSEMTGYAKIATGYRPVWKVLFGPLIRWVKVEVWYWLP
jgi:putative peptide zinc metalloprotease protein